MLLRRSLKAVPIHINSIWLLFFKNCVDSSLKIKTTPSNFENVLVISTGDFIKWLIRIPNHLILNLCFQVIFYGIIARRAIAITSSVIGKWHSKHRMERGVAFSTWLMTIMKTLNCCISKEDHGCKLSDIQIRYVLRLQELLQIMPQ